jgi:copper chaperone CopZ
MKLKLSILIGLLFAFSSQLISQTNSETIFVNGVCGMCEKRIESNCLNIKGVKMADWNRETGMLKIVFNEKKISLDSIRISIASIGHDTKLLTQDIESGWITAPDEVYEKLPMCCKYRDEEVVKNHP